MSTVPGCTCPHGEASLGRLYGVSMGRGTVRLSTTKGCPEHDACRGYTAAVRKARLAARWWDDPYCPIHGGRDCPPRAALARDTAEGES